MVNAILGMGRDLPQRLNAIEARLRDLSTQPILLHASTGQDGGQGLSTDKNGLHLFDPTGAESVTLSTIDGSANFNGNVNINGNLSVPNGSISNAALQAPVSPLAAHADASAFALYTGANVELARITVTVPAGFTKAAISATAIMNARNTTGSLDSAYLTCTINGAGNGWSAQVDAAAGNVAHLTKVITGILNPVGSTFYITAAASSGLATWTVDSAKALNLDAMILFYR
ncbi:hypothetical protein [Arthrobacter bambusae]|uniref:hypothetical protein n=1 Tax=Arthrobacter bambusae TaxID=1338426 RepID=UPI00278041DD|nr:hypothetical protein [Arthrobacter bambusae]MDQ0241152.1 hypothetical protein [Arthrobacter bambusae]